MVDFAFLDSGTGGIPYLVHLLKQAPDASCVYVGDTANFPYGEKTHEQIVNGVLSCVEKIITRFDPKVIVIACNTMSVNTLDVLREVYPDRQFVGTVPAIKVAGKLSKKHCIGLLATNSTVKHPYNQDLKNHFAADCKMVLRGDPDLISFIEHESFTANLQERKAACMPAVDFFREQGCDVIILGCTHFLNLSEEMQAVCGDEIKVVDSREGVVNRALALLGGAGGGTAKCGEACGDDANVCAGGERRAVLYVTGFTGQKDQAEYNTICERFRLEFGGAL